jgi:hypothetical protein
MLRIKVVRPKVRSSDDDVQVLNYIIKKCGLCIDNTFIHGHYIHGNYQQLESKVSYPSQTGQMTKFMPFNSIYNTPHSLWRFEFRHVLQK